MKKGNTSIIHSLAQFFAVRSRCDGVVLLTNDHKPAIANYPSTAMIYLLQTSKSNLSADEIKELPENVTLIPLKEVGRANLANKIFVCVDYLGKNSSIFKSYERRTLSSIAEDCALAVFSVDASTNWNIQKLQKSLRLNKSALFGKYLDKEIIAIGGRLTKVYGKRYPTVPVLAIISQFNEVDIIEPVVKHLLHQEVDVYVIDNWSNDGSYEAVKKLASAYPNRVSLERFPKHNTHKYEWEKILQRVTEIAKDKPHYRWIISNDADEIRWSPWPDISLQKTISFIDHLGFNVIDFTVFNFYPTKDGFERGVDPLEFFEYGDFGHEGWHFMQLKAWRNHPEADIAASSGHLVKIPGPKIFPLKFLLGHYPLRSNAQARKKIFQDRKPRFIADERKRGWHSHYDKIDENKNFISISKSLIDLSNRRQFLENYLIERLSGIGIKINKVNKG